MMLDLLPLEQAAPQLPARVVGGTQLLDTLVTVSGSGGSTVNGNLNIYMFIFD